MASGCASRSRQYLPTILHLTLGTMEIMYSGPWYLTEGDRSRIRTLGSVFMRVYLKLATEALSQNKFLWKCRPKLHLLHHIFRCHQRKNPAKYSTWMDEDWLRKVSKTLRLVDCTTAPKRVLQRWLLTLPLQLQHSMETSDRPARGEKNRWVSGISPGLRRRPRLRPHTF